MSSKHLAVNSWLFGAMEGYTVYQIKQSTSKLGYYFTNYDKFTGRC